jgi:hypothetical protein
LISSTQVFYWDVRELNANGTRWLSVTCLWLFKFMKIPYATTNRRMRVRRYAREARRENSRLRAWMCHVSSRKRRDPCPRRYRVHDRRAWMN